MPEQLPKGWVKTTLGEIAEPSRKRSLPTEVPGMRYVGLEHIQPQTMTLLEHGYASDVRSSSLRFSKGDVLYGKMRPYLNKVWVAEFEGICSAEFLVFAKRQGVRSEFLAARLNADDFVSFANGQVSGERPRVGFEKLSHFPIALPPGSEQGRIVEKLQTALTGVHRGGTAARRACERLQRYRATVLYAAVTGELTRAWRGAQQKSENKDSETREALLRRVLAAHRARWEQAEFKRLRNNGKPPKDDKWKSRYREPTPPKTEGLSELPKGWTWVAWEQVGFSQNGRPFPSKEYSDAGVKLLRPGNLYADGSIRWTDKNTRHIPLKWERENSDLVIHGNELVINLTAQSLKEEFLGRVCLTSKGEHCLLNQRLARLTPVLGVTKFFLHVFKSPLFRRFVDGLSSGSLIQHMFTSQLAKFALPFPPEAEQIEIVREVDRRLAAANRLAAKLDRQLERAGAARQSLLREAFAGRLVPQDPRDEPASILLGRIRASRQAEAQIRKGMPMQKLAFKSSMARRPLLDVLREQRKPITPEHLFREAGFEAAQVDLFYRELASLRDILRERKPQASEAKLWPDRSNVLLQLEKGTEK